MTFGKEDTTFREHLIYGDLAPQPLEALVTYIEEVRLKLKLNYCSSTLL